LIITSKDNEKLKLVRRLAERKHRDREGLFVTEGEDLLAAGRNAGFDPVVLLTEPASGLGGDEVERGLLDSASALGSGSRVIAVWPQRWSDAPRPLCVFLNGVRDPGNVGAIVRAADALGASGVALDHDAADPYSPKAVRASMGSVFNVVLSRCDVRWTPEPRAGMVAHGGAWPPTTAPATLCLGAEREGLAGEAAAACEELWTIPLAGKAESLGVAAAAAIALERVRELSDSVAKAGSPPRQGNVESAAHGGPEP
jgi:TrmH family RNA methyltransferase